MQCNTRCTVTQCGDMLEIFCEAVVEELFPKALVDHIRIRTIR